MTNRTWTGSYLIMASNQTNTYTLYDDTPATTNSTHFLMVERYPEYEVSTKTKGTSKHTKKLLKKMGR